LIDLKAYGILMITSFMLVLMTQHLEEQDMQYLFVEDFDGNEVCFGFSLKESELN
jgi:hypothetical protein